MYYELLQKAGIEITRVVVSHTTLLHVQTSFAVPSKSSASSFQLIFKLKSKSLT